MEEKKDWKLDWIQATVSSSPPEVPPEVLSPQGWIPRLLQSLKWKKNRDQLIK